MLNKIVIIQILLYKKYRLVMLNGCDDVLFELDPIERRQHHFFVFQALQVMFKRDFLIER
jgi:hypothetical protein